jgi:hypothetical protein
MLESPVARLYNAKVLEIAEGTNRSSTWRSPAGLGG